MDEQMNSLIPGQMVNFDGAIYLVVQTEDGSIALQEIKDYQHAVSQDNFCSFENFENLESSQPDFSRPNFKNVSEVVQKDQTNLVQVQTFSEPDAVNMEVLQTLSIEDKLKISSYIRELQDKGYVFDSETMNLLMSGAVNISDLRFEQGNETLQTESEEFRDGVNNLATGNGGHESLPDSNQHMILEMTDAQSNETGISLDENRKLKVMAFVQDAQNRGFSISNESIELLLNGEIDISDCRFSEGDVSHQSSNFETRQTDANICTQNSGDAHQNGGNSLGLDKNIDDEDDEEFFFVKQITESEEEARLCTITGTAVKPHSGFMGAFISFINGARQDPLMKSCDPVEKRNLEESLKRKYVTDDNKYDLPTESDFTNYRAYERYLSRGRLGTAFQRVIKKRGVEDGSEYEYDDSCWNLDRTSEAALENKQVKSNVPMPFKRKVGRPRGSGRNAQWAYGDEFDQMRVTPPRTSDYVLGRGGAQPRRGRGRPRKQLFSESHFQGAGPGEVLFTAPEDLNCYRVGDFVVERRNMFQDGMHPICCINGMVLQDFKAEVVNGTLIYCGESKYSKGNFDLRIKYKAVKVKSRNGNKVQVTMPYENKILNLNNDPLMDILKAYAQIFLYYAIDETFLCDVFTGNYGNMHQILQQVDGIIAECLESVQSMIRWKSDFKESMDTLPYYRICVLRSGHHYPCQEIDCLNMNADKMVSFFGPRYDYNTLRIIGKNNGAAWLAPEKETDNNIDFFISDTSIEFIRLYHALRHFKLGLYREASYETSERLMRGNGQETLKEEDIILDALREDLWIQNQLMILKELVTKSGISLEVKGS